MPATGRVEIDRERCKGCERCVAVCPRGLLRLGERPNRQGYRPAESRTDGERGPCTGCATCGIVCPELAITVYAARAAERAAERAAAGRRAPEREGS